MNGAILLTGAQYQTKSGWDAFSLNKNYAEAVRRCDALPLLAVDGKSADDYASMADGLILTGGADISPAMYGESELHRCTHVSPLRDEMELSLLRSFLSAKKPILGICRGLQLLNVFFGGTLWPHLSDNIGESHEQSVHAVSIVSDSILGDLFGSHALVNSYHHQGIRTLGSNLRPLAYSQANGKNTLVEAFIHEKRNILAVQWHPERMLDGANTPCMLPLFRWFVEQTSGDSLRPRE
ncbi:MAG TPA: amidotransferase [Synergistaceae bacterium]|jgi:putative glutamine amidotransferase|nr:amidotransferase [Synergistaceae bacterium]